MSEKNGTTVISISHLEVEMEVNIQHHTVSVIKNARAKKNAWFFRQVPYT